MFQSKISAVLCVLFTTMAILFTAGCEVTTVPGPGPSGHCPFEYPYLCNDGTCAASPSSCSLYSNGCPFEYPNLCSDGTCALYASDCGGSTNGCPSDAPYLCGDGYCAYDAGYCSDSFCPSYAPYDCGDGTCGYTPNDCYDTNAKRTDAATPSRIRPLQARKLSSKSLQPNLN